MPVRSGGEVAGRLEVLEVVSAVDAMLLVSAETRPVVRDEELAGDVLVDCDGNDKGDLVNICCIRPLPKRPARTSKATAATANSLVRGETILAARGLSRAAPHFPQNSSVSTTSAPHFPQCILSHLRNMAHFELVSAELDGSGISRFAFTTKDPT
jgi:hypothetical protein